MSWRLCVIAACTPDGGMGYDNRLPWDLKEDMRHFARTTRTASPGYRNAIIMGRKTWESLSNHTLPGRMNIVVSTTLGDSTDPTSPDGPFFAKSLTDALTILDSNIETVFVIGGARLFAEALAHPKCSCAYVTEIRLQPEPVCDVFFPLHELLDAFVCTKENAGLECIFRQYKRREINLKN